MKGENIKTTQVIKVFDALESENLGLLEKVLGMDDDYRVDITKEIQRNNFCFQLLSRDGQLTGFAY